MAKTKLNLCFLCFVVFVVAGSNSSEASNSPNSNPNQNPNEADDLKLSLVLQRLETLENKHQKLEKSHAELKKSFKALTKEVEDLKNENCVGEDVWLLRPPLRGRRGQKGEKGDSGIITTKPGEESGQKGQIQIPTLSPSQNPPEQKGSSGIPAPHLKSLTSCSDAMEIFPSPRSQKQIIYSHGNGTSLEVLCDFETDGGGWTVIQKRSSGPKHEFNKNWNEYEKGFGSLDKNFWIGLENIRALTQNGDQELRIELEDFEQEKKYAKYSNFSVSDASDFYRLSIGGYSGDAGDDMNYSSRPDEVHKGMQFSTPDKDNDKSTRNCAEYYSGSGWWFNYCFRANLNGLYFEEGETSGWNGIIWESWEGIVSLAKTEMKIRTRK